MSLLELDPTIFGDTDKIIAYYEVKTAPSKIEKLHKVTKNKLLFCMHHNIKLEYTDVVEGQ